MSPSRGLMWQESERFTHAMVMEPHPYDDKAQAHRLNYGCEQGCSSRLWPIFEAAVPQGRLTHLVPWNTRSTDTVYVPRGGKQHVLDLRALADRYPCWAWLRIPEDAHPQVGFGYMAMGKGPHAHGVSQDADSQQNIKANHLCTIVCETRSLVGSEITAEDVAKEPCVQGAVLPMAAEVASSTTAA